MNNKLLRYWHSLDCLNTQKGIPCPYPVEKNNGLLIATALASDREYVVMDEPTSGLDYKHMKEVALCLKQLKELGKSVFVITHDVELIYHCCTYVVHIEAGKVINQYAIDKSTHTLLRDYFSVAIS